MSWQHFIRSAMPVLMTFSSTGPSFFIKIAVLTKEDKLVELTNMTESEIRAMMLPQVEQLTERHKEILEEQQRQHEATERLDTALKEIAEEKVENFIEYLADPESFGCHRVHDVPASLSRLIAAFKQL